MTSRRLHCWRPSALRPPKGSAQSDASTQNEQPGETSIEEWSRANLAIPTAEYQRTFSVNSTSVWYTTMACLPLLDRGNKKGNLDWSSQVVVTSSIAGFNRKAPGGFAYGQSKAAATHAVKMLAVVLPTWGIRSVFFSPFFSLSMFLSSPLYSASSSGYFLLLERQ